MVASYQLQSGGFQRNCVPHHIVEHLGISAVLGSSEIVVLQSKLYCIS